MRTKHILKTIGLGSAILCFAISCGTLVRSVNGEGKPKNETLESLEVFINENNLPIDVKKTLFLKNKESKLKLSSLRGYDNGYYVAVPNIFVYDKDFWLIDDLKLGGCITTRPDLQGADFYREILAANVGTEKTFNLSEWKGAFMDYTGRDYFPFENNGKAKVIILWSKYKGKMWASEVSGMIDPVKNSEADIELFFLNMDEYFIPDHGMAAN